MSSVRIVIGAAALSLGTALAANDGVVKLKSAYSMPETIERPRLRAIVRWVIGPAMIIEKARWGGVPSGSVRHITVV